MLCSLQLLATTLLVAAVSAHRPEATTPSGVVRGFVLNGTNVWRGIPYAMPPLKDLRFRPPVSPIPWSEPLDTIDFGASCPQMGSPGTGYTQAAWNSLNLSKSGEDCLYLNVYAPAYATSLPVMVWLNAGEFRFGSSNDLENNWPYFANGHVVLVTGNFRIGLLGFAALDILRSRDPAGSSGNYGMQDQRAIIGWVKQSIASFGGNPDKITIFGESSGGSSVAFHLVSNASKRFFSQAILESPGLTQSKSWDQTVVNTEFALSALTAAGSMHCLWPQSSKWISLPGLETRARGPPLAVVNRDEAFEQCGKRSDCFLLYNSPDSNMTSLFGGGTPGELYQSFVMMENQTLKLGKNPGSESLFRRPSLGDDAAKCLVSADASDLVSLDIAPPYGDTFYTDSVAPTVDGIELVAPLGSLSISAVSSDIPLLAGSNLDEGTEFMYSVPHIACNASKDEFAAWALDQFGPERGAQVPQVYDDVEQPAPLCRARHSDVNTSKYWQAAMRSAGDDAILCPTWELLRQTNRQNGTAWWYYFTHTPKYSVNMNGLQYYGAFHGAEVPFVFGDAFELMDDAERSLSEAIGCYWVNFAASGNPNRGPSNCSSALSLPEWPVFGPQGDALELSKEIRKRPSLKNKQCSWFSKERQGAMLNTLFV